MFVCLLACLLVCLFVCRIACLLVCLFVCLLACLLACLPACLLTCLLVLFFCLLAGFSVFGWPVLVSASRNPTGPMLNCYVAASTHVDAGKNDTK